MVAPQRLCRSVLYVPASKTRALEKVGTLDVDSIIFDLEDAVAPVEKLSARETLARALDAGNFGHRQRIVRINGTDTEWGEADARAVAGIRQGLDQAHDGRGIEASALFAKLAGDPDGQ